VPWSILKECLSIDIEIDEVKLCLKQDSSVNIFSYIEDGDIIESDNTNSKLESLINHDDDGDDNNTNNFNGRCNVNHNVLIGLKNMTNEIQLIKQSINQWRQMIIQRLIQCDGPVDFSSLASKVPRPIMVPTSVKIKDVLMTDLMKTFIITCNEKHDLWLVSLSQHDNHDVQSIFEEKWKNDIANFLYKQTIQMPLTRLGIEVPRPANLNKKLSEVLRSDLKQRFVLVPNPTNNETVVHVHMTTTQKEKYCEKWRRNIIDFITSTKQKYIFLNVLAASVSRPYMGCNVIIGSGTVKLKKVLLEDPQNRFKLTGELNKVKVSLSPLHKTEVRCGHGMSCFACFFSFNFNID